MTANPLELRVVPTEFTVSDEVLRGNFVMPLAEGVFPGICKFHGLPGSADQVQGIASRLAAVGFIVLTFDFRGFRRSDGIFRLANQVEDAQCAVSHLLKSEHAMKNWVGVYSASYGGSVAVLAAARDTRIRVICLRAPVYDTLDFARSPLIQPGVDDLVAHSPDVIHGLADPQTQTKILKNMVDDAKTLNPIREISLISPRPLLIITGDADTEITLDGVRRLYALAKEPKKFVVIQGADHTLTSPRAFEETMNIAVNWFQQQKQPS